MMQPIRTRRPDGHVGGAVARSISALFITASLVAGAPAGAQTADEAIVTSDHLSAAADSTQ
ncbi:MAG: hypothetical protein IT196_00730, partial [Acidimicrobiales bacterium]|nr:hypothetical protein [Acidimicrobiales bacterium]